MGGRNQIKTMKNRVQGLSSCLLAIATLAIFSASPPADAQTFTLDNPLLTARWQHGAALLPNGLVLMAGGKFANDFSASDFANTNSCELYDVATGVSRATMPMAEPHADGALIQLPNGKALAVGGEDFGFASSAVAELFDPTSNTWTNTGSLHADREGFPAVLLPNGKVAVFGGYDNNFGIELNSTEIYDPASGTWSSGASMGFGADSQSATVLQDGTVLVAGGSIDGFQTNAALLYNPTSNTFTNAGSMNDARSGHAAVLLPNGKALVVGGAVTAELYDPSSHTWTRTAPLNTYRSYPSATLLTNGQVLVIGGDPGETSAELYNPTNDTWTLTGSLNAGRVFHTATLVAGGQVLVAGGDAGTIGYFNGPPMPDVETYNQTAQFNLIGSALGNPNLNWTNSGDTNWFVETTNTFLSAYAVQSGSVTNNQSTTLSVTVTGPGVVTFFWSSIANDTNGGFFYKFYIDNLDAGIPAYLSGSADWNKVGPFSVPAGQHTLNWSVTANGDTDPTEAGYLDQVEYSAFSSTTPVIAPIGWWKGNDNAFDSAGTNNGVLQGNVAYAPGILGPAFNFDGGDEYVELPAVSSALPQGTISLWTYVRSWNWFSAPAGMFLWSGVPYLPDSGHSFDGINLGTHRSFTATGELMFGIFTSSWNWAFSGVVPQTNTWYHVAGTWGPGGICVYVNGQLKGTNSYTGPAPGDALYNLIGRSSWDNSEINGMVDDVRLYNRALSASEISQLAQVGGPPVLSITPLGLNVLLSWPQSASGFILQSSPSLAPTNWTTVTNQVFTVGTNSVVTNAAGGSTRFYRLKQ